MLIQPKAQLKNSIPQAAFLCGLVSRLRQDILYLAVRTLGKYTETKNLRAIIADLSIFAFPLHARYLGRTVDSLLESSGCILTVACGYESSLFALSQKNSTVRK